MAPTLVEIVGSLYDARTGGKIVAGRLEITPRSFIPNGDDMITPTTISYDIPATGDVSIFLSPSYDDIVYDVVYDPDPASETPQALRPGFFENTWTVPSAGPVQISSL